MSKRGAGNWGGDEDRYGGGPEADMDGSDKPVQATAAQLARRKLLKPKARSDRGRSDSPAVQPQNSFGQTATNPFTASSFNFVTQQPQQANGTSFQFGQSQPAATNPPPQNGTSNIFSQSSAPAFGGFGSTAPQPQPQPQQNGFNASTSLFNLSSQQSSTPSFGGFGQNSIQTTQQNGTTTPATSFGGLSNASQPSTQNSTGMSGNIFSGFGAKPAESSDKAANPFASFSQKPQENGTPATNGFSGFGQQTQENGSSRASTPVFGGSFGQKAPEQADKPANDSFGQRPQETGEQSSNIFSKFAQKAPESSSSSTSTNPFAGFNGFGQKPAENSSKPLFPASQPEAQTPKATSSTGMFGQAQPAQSAQSAAPSTGLFGSNPMSNTSTLGTGLFGSKPTTSEVPQNGGSIFDNLPKKDSSALKINFSSADPKQVYNGEDDDDETQPAENQQPPKMNPFSGFSQSQQTAKPAANVFGQSAQTPLFTNGASEQDTTMSTPGATPQKPLFASTTPSSTPAVSSTPAAQPPRSLFDRINNPQTDETPKASLFSTADETPKASLFNTVDKTPKPALFSTTPASSTTKSLFPSTTPAANSATPAATSSLFQKPAASAEETPRAAPPRSIFAQSAAAPSTPTVAPTAPAAIFQAPPATAPVSRTTAPPASPKVMSSNTAAASAKLNDSQQQSMKALNEGLLAHMKTQQPGTDWSSIYRYALIMAAEISGRSSPSDVELNPVVTAQNSSTSSGSAPSTTLSNPTITPAAASSSASNKFAQTPRAASSAPLFSQAPATAPTKKRQFQEDADELSQAPATEKRIKPNQPTSYPKLPETASNTAKLFASTLDKPAAAESARPAAPSGFAPSNKPLFSTSSTTPAATPATGGFKPTTDTSASSATTTSGGFKPTLTAGTSGGSFLSSFGALAKKQEDADRQKRKDNDYDSDEETEEQWEKRDKAEQEEKRRKFEEAAKSALSFSLGSATPKPATAEKPETPLKFNLGDAATTTPTAAAPLLFGSTFGAANNASSKLAPPSASLAASRATTPGTTTDGEGSNATNGDKANAEDGEPSDEQTQPQASDEINDLQPAEREANEVLLEVQDVRTSKMGKNEDGNKQVWKPKTRGRFFILKDKKTGQVRMLSRTGAGRTVLNHFPNKEATFKVHPKKATMIVASLFVDHIHTNPPGPGQWMFSTPDKDDAEKIAKLLTEGTPK